MDKYINLYIWSHLIASFSSNFSWSLFPFTIHGSEFVFLLLNIIFFFQTRPLLVIFTSTNDSEHPNLYSPKTCLFNYSPWQHCLEKSNGTNERGLFWRWKEQSGFPNRPITFSFVSEAMSLCFPMKCAKIITNPCSWGTKLVEQGTVRLQLLSKFLRTTRAALGLSTATPRVTLPLYTVFCNSCLINGWCLYNC